MNILIGVITVLLVALLYILYRSNLQRKSANRLLDQKVKERTTALESGHLALKQSLADRNVVVATTFTNIKSSTAAIKRLCSLGLQDGRSEESKKYLDEIHEVTGRVSMMLDTIQINSK